MPQYDFQDVETGEHSVIVMPMSDAVSIGDTMEHNGRTLRRVVSSGQVMDQSWKQWPRVSNSLPRFMPGCRHMKDGRPIVENKRHERNICSEHEYVKD
jgi:hypothetical protein